MQNNLLNQKRVKKTILILIIGILLMNLVNAFNFNRDYCNRFSINMNCICKENENKVEVWKPLYCPPEKLCAKYFKFVYAYCEKEGREEIATKIAETIYNALIKSKYKI